MSLLPDVAPEFSSPTGITDDVLVSADPPTTLKDLCEFQEGEDLKSASELNMSITPDIEHYDKDDSEDICLQESCDEVLEPTILEFIDDILYIEYESFSCRFDVTVGLDVDLYVEYETFSFDPAQLTSFLNVASLNLLSLIMLSLRILT